MKVSRPELFIVSMAFLAVIFIPCQMLAQGTNPLPCCDKVPPPDPNSVASAGSSSQFTIADSMLSAMGISRSLFLDRLVAGLFLDQKISLIISVTSVVSGTTSSSTSASTAEVVTVTYQYLIPLSDMQPEQIDTLNQFVITNGVTSIQIKFTQTQSTLPLS